MTPALENAMTEPARVRPGFDPQLAGRRAECDGGGLLPGGRYASRQAFAGTLTGEYYDEGDPPWRWYRMHALTHKPADFPYQAVWCESESVFLVGPDPDAHLARRRRTPGRGRTGRGRPAEEES